MISREDIVLEARKWIGTPYRHQGSVQGVGADCLGLVLGVLRHLFKQEPQEIPAYTPDWGETSGEEVLLNGVMTWLTPRASVEIEVGSVVLFRMRKDSIAKHLGIAANLTGIPTVIHAYTGHGVVESYLTSPWMKRVAGQFDFPLGVK